MFGRRSCGYYIVCNSTSLCVIIFNMIIQRVGLPCLTARSRSCDLRWCAGKERDCSGTDNTDRLSSQSNFACEVSVQLGASEAAYAREIHVKYSVNDNSTFHVNFTCICWEHFHYATPPMRASGLLFEQRMVRYLKSRRACLVPHMVPYGGNGIYQISRWFC